MIDKVKMGKAVKRLQSVQKRVPQDSELKTIIDAKGDVLKRFQSVFRPGKLSFVTCKTFKDFLDFDNKSTGRACTVRTMAYAMILHSFAKL